MSTITHAAKKSKIACRNGNSCPYGAKCKFDHSAKEEEAARSDILDQMNTEFARQKEIGLKLDAAGITRAFFHSNRIQKCNLIGEYLYPIIKTALEEGQETMKATGLWHEYINAGRITGMLLEAYEPEDALDFLSNSTRLADLMVEACAMLKAHGEKLASKA